MANQHQLTYSSIVGWKPLVTSRGPWDAAPLRDHQAIGLMISFWAVAVLGGTSPLAARVVELGLAPAAMMIGFRLWRSSSASYLSFIWQLFFFASCIRRLADFQLGWNATNPIVIAPYAAAVWCGITLLRPRRAFLRCFGVIAVGLAWAFAVGVVFNGIPAAAFALLEWGVGPLIAGYVLTAVDKTNVIRSLRATAVIGVLLMGFYGIAQYLMPAGWDVAWIFNARMTSAIGIEAGKLRVFSTMNSPWPFAMTLMGLLVFIIGLPGWVSLRALALMSGLIVLIASQTRAAWGGLIVGWMMLVLFAGRARSRFMAAAALLVVIGALAVIAMPTSTTALTHRVATLGSLSADDSYAVRMHFYVSFLGEAFTQPIGTGFGRTGVATRLSDDASMQHFDSGLMNVPFVLGWIGAAAYLAGLGTLCVAIIRRRRNLSPAGLAAAAACVALLSQMLFLNSLVAATGVIFWTLLGYCLIELDDDQLATAISRLKSLAGK